MKLECDTCLYNDRTWDEEPCDSCTFGGETNHYIPTDHVSRQLVLDAITKYCTKYDLRDLLADIEGLPPEESEHDEIIFCPACKYGEGPYHNVRCTKYYGMGGPYDYCSMAERKEAIWQKKDLGGVEYTGVCSNCGYGSFWSEVKNYILCPNCGAKMKVEEIG